MNGLAMGVESLITNRIDMNKGSQEYWFRLHRAV